MLLWWRKLITGFTHRNPGFILAFIAGFRIPRNILPFVTAPSSSWPTYLATPPGPFKRQKEGDKICDLLDDLPIGYFELPEMISRRCGPQRSKRLRIPRERLDFC